MAQIVTITNPLTGQPTQVDQLEHTAQQIDDAIARALPGGEIDITLQQITGATNAAEYSATATYAIGDYCTHDGKLYRCTTAITEPEAWTEAHWTETTVGAELTAIYTALADKLGGIESPEYPGCYYRMVSGVVEWFNPPMTVGVEYRTTERHLGKPVYVKTLSFGALPNATTKSIGTGIKVTYAVIDRSVYAINNGGYAVVDLNRFELEDKFVNGGPSWSYYITATVDFSAYTTTYVTFKYTKD